MSHEILTPEGKSIFVPQSAFADLRRLRCLTVDRATHKQQIAFGIYQFLKPEFDTLTNGLRRLLGDDVSGPEYTTCSCRKCQREKEQRDPTRPPTDRS